MLHGVGVDRETGSGFGRRFRKESEKMKKNGTKKINVVTLGCSKNVVDSEHLMAQLAAAGYEVVFDSNGTDARTVVVNTCGFIGDAKEESINTILGFVQAKEEGAIDRLFVIGCLSERYAEELRSEIPEVDDYFGARDFTAVVRALTGGEGSAPATERMLTTPAHYAYLKISEGCNWRCAYCAIPLIRGPHVSVPEEQVLEEARRLVARGVKELIVVAQDTTYYGVDLYGERRLAPLLRRLAALPGVEWVRLHYTYPTGFPVEVMEAMREESKICRYIDIPLQHIADRQLSAMRRGITKQGTEELIARLRREVPGRPCWWDFPARARRISRNSWSSWSGSASSGSAFSPIRPRRGPRRRRWRTTYPRRSSRSVWNVSWSCSATSPWRRMPRRWDGASGWWSIAARATTMWPVRSTIRPRWIRRFCFLRRGSDSFPASSGRWS
mgnify:CR=1 FL=1